MSQENDILGGIIKSVLGVDIEDLKKQQDEVDVKEFLEHYGSQRLIVSVDETGVHVDLPKNDHAFPDMLQDLLNSFFTERILTNVEAMKVYSICALQSANYLKRITNNAIIRRSNPDD